MPSISTRTIFAKTQGRTWLKRVLIPFWTVDLIWFTASLVLASFRLRKTAEWNNANGTYVIHEATSRVGVFIIITATLSIVFDIVSVVLFARRRLQPVTYIVLQCIKTAFWTSGLIWNIVSVADAYENGYDSAYTIFASLGPYLAFALTPVIFACSLGQLLYGTVVLHRKCIGRVPHQKGDMGYDTALRDSGVATGKSFELNVNPSRDSVQELSPVVAPSTTPPVYREGSQHSAFQKSVAGDEYKHNAAEESYTAQGMQYSGS